MDIGWIIAVGITAVADMGVMILLGLMLFVWHLAVFAAGVLLGGRQAQRTMGKNEPRVTSDE